MAASRGVFGQSEGPTISVSVDGFRYPRIAAIANLQGDVVFVVSGAERRLVSSNALLSQAAEKNLGTWTLPPLDRGHYEVRYRFRFLEKPVCESEVRTLPAQTSISHSGDDVVIAVLVQATRYCAHY